MATDDERREVARKLREVNPYRNQSYTVPYHRYTPAAEYLSELAGALGYSPKNDVSRLEFQSRLADLIEPDATSEQTNHDESSLSASPIDRDALLALADEMDSAGEDGLLVRDSDLMAWTYRIRKALGVVE